MGSEQVWRQMRVCLRCPALRWLSEGIREGDEKSATGGILLTKQVYRSFFNGLVLNIRHHHHVFLFLISSHAQDAMPARPRGYSAPRMVVYSRVYTLSSIIITLTAKHSFIHPYRSHLSSLVIFIFIHHHRLSFPPKEDVSSSS